MGLRLLYFLLSCGLTWFGNVEKDELEAIMLLTGAVSVEELESQEVERLSHALRNPLPINTANTYDFEQLGYLTPYQIASIIDYRSRHGNIFSLSELAYVDGFNLAVVQALAPFISLDANNRSLDDKSRTKVQQDFHVRSAYSPDKEQYSYGLKYRLTAGGFGCSLSASSGDRLPSLSGNLTYESTYGKLILGDFNARFGQGLGLWNTAVIGGLNSPSTYMRKSSGVTPTFSYTGSSALTGAAGTVSFGEWRVTGILAAPGLKSVADAPDKVQLMPAFNISKYMRNGLLSMTHNMSFSEFTTPDFRIPKMTTSVDISLCIRGVNLFSECLYDWVNTSVEAVSGVDFRVGDGTRIASLVKYLKDEQVAAVSGECLLDKKNELIFSLETSHKSHGESQYSVGKVQVKSQLAWNYKVCERFMVKFRLVERFRTWGHMYKTDARIDFIYEHAHLYASMRLNLMNCVNTAGLGYLEGGYRKNYLAFYLRFGLFAVDDWEDRIYVYERDAPGSFNVPAYYGRGYWTAATFSWKAASWCRLYLRGALKKPGKAELKFQCVFRL